MVMLPSVLLRYPNLWMSYQNATNMWPSWFTSITHITIGMNMNGMLPFWQTSGINIHQNRLYGADLPEIHFTMFAITFISPQHWPSFPIWFGSLHTFSHTHTHNKKKDNFHLALEEKGNIVENHFTPLNQNKALSMNHIYRLKLFNSATWNEFAF